MYLLLQIKTDLGWQKAVLPKDATIQVEDINPIFDIEAGGAFSFPFTLSVEANQHIFPTLTDHHGARIHDLLYHKPFRLSAGGFPLLYGVIDLDEEVEVKQEDDGTHTVGINLRSSNQELSALLDGVNAQDIPLKSRIPVGTEFHSLECFAQVVFTDFQASFSVDLPAHEFSLNRYPTSLDDNRVSGWINSTNVEDPYPTKPYCNAMIAVQARESDGNGGYTTLREYEVFDADRANSGLCFYVLYFLDCLFNYIDCAFNNDNLCAMEDFTRLAFFTTKCECDTFATAVDLIERIGTDGQDIHEIKNLFPNFDLGYENPTGGYRAEVTARATAFIKYANSKNFPAVDAINIISELQNAFGIRFIYDSEGQRCRAVFIKDIFNDNTTVKSGAIIHSAYHADRNIRGVRLTYGGGDDDTSFNYDPSDDESVVVIKDSFNDIRDKKGMYDKNTYYDRNTGNEYRIKVDDDAKTESELYPSLFEVGQYHDAYVGDVKYKDLSNELSKEDELVKEFTIGFNPIISNLLEYIDASKSRETTSITSYLTDSSKEKNDVAHFAVFIDKELDDPQTQVLWKSFLDGEYTGLPDDVNANQLNYNGIYIGRYGSGQKVVGPPGFFNFYYLTVEFKTRYAYTQDSLQRNNEQVKEYWHGRTPEKTDRVLLRYEEDPLSTYDAGFSLGIMRGPGNKAGVEIVRTNYDGYGNSQWASTPNGYAFTSDSIDNYGRDFDYNGSQSGGIDPTGRFSLKLEAEKRKGYNWQKDDQGNIVVSTREEAEYWLSDLFGYSNRDLFKLPLRKKTAIAAAGYNVSTFPQLEEYVAVYPLYYNLTINGTTERVMFTPLASGKIFTQSEMDAYIGELRTNLAATGEIQDYRCLIIKRGVTNPTYESRNIINLTNIYYSAYPHEPITLLGVSSEDSEFYPISSQHAHRGLLHKFNYEYFWFLIHARPITLDLSMTIEELTHLDKNRWHTFGQYRGLIEKISYEVNNETGLSHVTLTLLYL